MSASNEHVLCLEPRDPLIVRDARPFSAEPGARAVTLDWPLPQTIAGAIRTYMGDGASFDWRGDGPELARRIGVHGPLLAVQRHLQSDWEAYLPAPRDALLWRDASGQLHCEALRPVYQLPEGAGTNLPPGLLPLSVGEEVKPDGSAAYWSLGDHLAWLAHPARSQPPDHTVGHLPREVRVHVTIDHDLGRAKEHALFSTAGLAFPDAPYEASADPLPSRREPMAALAMLCRVSDAPAGWAPTPALVPVGGERRLVAVEPVPCGWPATPPELVSALTGAPRLRLQLVTPAVFGAGGWRPDWLDRTTLRGSPPGVPDLTLELVGAAVGRRIPVSGWDLKEHGPKAVRYAVPGGSVYFFTVFSGSLAAAQVAALWLQPTVSETQDRRDGFGLTVPGIW